MGPYHWANTPNGERSVHAVGRCVEDALELEILCQCVSHIASKTPVAQTTNWVDSLCGDEFRKVDNDRDYQQRDNHSDESCV